MNERELYGTIIEKPGSELEYELQLNYYLNKEPVSSDSLNPIRYGITIEKAAVFSSGSVKKEEKTINNIFYRRDDAEKFLKILIRGKVTPVTFAEIAEEYVSGLIVCQ